MQGGLIGVEYDKRIVMVVMSHVGIEPDQLTAALADPKTSQVHGPLYSLYYNYYCKCYC